ncbi:MAG: SDR family NAD(P)-dependent oxidoreductase [Legionella sp.]|nr:SDR family NAD(P)-dependent oxidoreductase [Legionella sp.]
MFVVTGGGSGIGRALAQALAQRGKEVLIIGRRREALLETAASYPLISICNADVATVKGREAIASHVQSIAQLEGLVHNAGVIEPIMPVASIDEPSWENALAVNLNAPLFLSQLLLDKLADGRVLHIGSAVAYFPVAGWAAYCVSKAALSMLTRCLQLECKNTSFTSVMPGIIDTDMQAFIRQSQFMADEKNNFYKELKAANRLLQPETVALFLTWLLLDINREDYVAKEWDIYDDSHHSRWLLNPHTVPHWEL